MSPKSFELYYTRACVPEMAYGC